jgi:hypothetical protein
MDNPGAFFLVVIAFFFFLWLAGGGPNRQISFAGPYITPVTNENQTQVGYGPQLKIGGTVKLPGATVTAGEKTSGAAQTQYPAPQNTSTYRNAVTVAHVAGNSNNPSGYAEIIVSPSAGQSIDITGWSVTSSANRLSGQIPTGVLLLQLGANNTLQDILLKPGDKATVTAGMSPAVSSFQANGCTGYLASQQSSYTSCLKAHVNDPGFLSGIWYVYLGRSTAVWKSSGDTISVLDGSGKVVASTSY